jgi:hypothetical protein
MSRRGPALHRLSAASGILTLALLGCSSKVTLGSWLNQVSVPTPATPDAGPAETSPPSATSAISNIVDASPPASSLDATAPSSSAPKLPECDAPGTPEAFNREGNDLGATETATDWVWPSPLTSMEWGFVIERDVAQASLGPSSGYYFAQQFAFERGVAGILGLQANGGYQADPPQGGYVFTKMIAFWLSGPPSAAELGDIPYPDARVAATTANGSSWLTIHAKFDWQVCHAYQLRFGPESTTANGSTWYGAWLVDLTTATTTFIGRMLLASDTGELSPFSTTLSTPIDFGQPTSCGVSEHMSVIFANPTGNDGSISSTSHTNRFKTPTRCPTSRFSELSGGVRHELGVPRAGFP